MEDFEQAKNAGYSISQKLYAFSELEKPIKDNLINMQANSRKALQLLGLNVIEARALKNRFSANSVAELVSAFLDRSMQNQQASFVKEVNECLLNQAQTDRFIELIQEIVTLRDLNEQQFAENG
jgi:hypothetical protein